MYREKRTYKAGAMRGRSGMTAAGALVAGLAWLTRRIVTRRREAKLARPPAESALGVDGTPPHV